MSSPKRQRLAVLGLAGILLALASSCGRILAESEGKKDNAKPLPAWKPRARIPAGIEGERIRLGRNIFSHTPKYAPDYVGNQLSCSDCHLDGGTATFSSPMIGLPGLFPMYNKRAGRVISLVERIQECFVRSENGKPPAAGSPEMAALLAYMDWLSQGQPKGRAFPGRGLVKLPALHGDPGLGAAIYAKRCAVCHGDDGAGVPPILPPLWGATAFNDGAGMSKVEKMAAFVQHNMPQNAPGSLSAEEAYDVAAYVNSKPRPKMNPAYKRY